MAERQATRNEAIASAFARIPVGEIPGSHKRHFLMERRGDGVPTIFRATRELSGRPAEYRLLNDSDLFLTLPAADTVATPGQAAVSVRADGRPLPSADVLALFPSGSWKRAVTDEDGCVRFDLWSKTRPMTVFVAASGHASHLERDWIPASRDLSVTLRPLAGGGSAVLANSSDRVPGLESRLRPERDAHDRTYLYADHVAINDGQRQPVHFTPGEELRITDFYGAVTIVRLMAVVGGASLVEYRAAPVGP